MSELSRDEFAAHEGTKFTIFFGEENPVEAELAEVSQLRQNQIQESFSLVFLAPPDAPLMTGVTKLEHEQLGTLELAISPFKQDEKGTKFEAVFNRLLLDR